MRYLLDNKTNISQFLLNHSSITHTIRENIVFDHCSLLTCIFSYFKPGDNILEQVVSLLKEAKCCFSRKLNVDNKEVRLWQGGQRGGVKNIVKTSFLSYPCIIAQRAHSISLPRRDLHPTSLAKANLIVVNI